jgi:hypothetical protein
VASWGYFGRAGGTKAIEHLRAAADQAPLDARVWSDLAGRAVRRSAASRQAVAVAGSACGRITYSRQRPSDAERDLRLAAQRFASAGSPMALVARYYAANTRFDQNDVSRARAELESLVQQLDAFPSFVASATPDRGGVPVNGVVPGQAVRSART